MRKDGNAGKGVRALEKGMGVWGKVRVLWRKDGSVGKGMSTSEKGWKCVER